MKRIYIVALIAFFPFIVLSQGTESIPSEGNISARNEKNVTLLLDSIVLIPKDSVYVLSKYFENQWGKATISGWLVIAEVDVISSKGNVAIVRILTEKSEITLNEEKVDHFKIGNRIKLEKKAPDPEEK